MESLPKADFGYASLYTPRHNVRGREVSPGWQAVDLGGAAWGSLAYCFTRESLCALLHSKTALLHPGAEGTDQVVSKAMQSIGRRTYFHIPSLCEHVGGNGNSSVGHHSPPGTEAVDFDPEFDPESDVAPEKRIQTTSPHATAGDNGLCDVSVIIKTFERPGCLERLLASIRARYPKIWVIIADDSQTLYAHRFRDERTTILSLPFDSGVSEGRNAALQCCRTPFFVLCDDDFAFDERTRLPVLRRMLEERDVDILGGEVFNPSPDGQFNRPFKYNLHIEFVTADHLWLRPIPASTDFTRCDVVANFFMARTAVIRDRLGGWDERLKTLEHNDFFLRARCLGLRTAYAPMVSLNHVPHRNVVYNRYRRRVSEHLSIWMRKHGLKRFTQPSGTVIELPSEAPVRSSAVRRRRRMEDNFRLLNDALQATPLQGRYWLSFGALLGYHREGRLLPHDPDIDFGFFSRDHARFLVAVDAVLAAGFHKKYRWTNSAGQVTEYSFVKDGAKFEFFLHFAAPDPRRMRWYLYCPGQQLEYVREQPTCRLQEIRFLDRTWLAPQDLDGYLRQLYGDWRTPDPHFSEESRPCNLRCGAWSGASDWV